MSHWHLAGTVLLAAASMTLTGAGCSRPEVNAAPQATPSTTTASSAEPATPQSAPLRTGSRTRALLIGVTAFVDPSMTKHNLRGPENDVQLFKQVLERAPFNVPSADISVLAGVPADASRRPTRANIEREFRRLRDVAAAGDQIVVLMAGHGSQQDIVNRRADDAPDRLDILQRDRLRPCAALGHAQLALERRVPIGRQQQQPAQRHGGANAAARKIQRMRGVAEQIHPFVEQHIAEV